MHYFSKKEWLLWGSSVSLVVLSFFIFGNRDYLNMASSLVGVTSLIFCAKGNPIGQILIIVFSVLYGMISFSFGYYGEMLTYLFMTAPMAVLALVSWLKNPYHGNRAEVAVKRLQKKDVVLMLTLSLPVTLVFGALLAWLGTPNLIPSTASITTSFIAVFLTFLRSPYFAVAYAANDVVLIVLWAMAGLSDPSYFSVMVCFIVFLMNDIYGFVSWMKMQKRQEKHT